MLPSARWRRRRGMPGIRAGSYSRAGRGARRRLVCDECGYSRSDFSDSMEDAAVDGLLLDCAEEPLGYAVGFRLVREG
jgi:hypothetical protein